MYLYKSVAYITVYVIIIVVINRFITFIKINSFFLLHIIYCQMQLLLKKYFKKSISSINVLYVNDIIHGQCNILTQQFAIVLTNCVILILLLLLLTIFMVL